MLKICRKKFCSSVSRFDLIEQCPTSTHPAEKNNSCMHCMPMILLFVQAPFLLLTLFVAIIFRTVFFSISLFGSFVQLNLPHRSFSPPTKYFIKILHNAFLDHLCLISKLISTSLFVST